MGCARAKRGWSVSVAYWLIALYVLSLGAPGLQAAGALAAQNGASVVELCTGEGLAHVLLDSSGRPLGQAPLDHPDHAAHQCPSCPATWGKHPCCPAVAASPSRPAFSAARLNRSLVDLRPGPALVAGAPLPARGPPSLA